MATVCGTQLQSLPSELLDSILSFLPTADLRSAALTARCIYTPAINLLWRVVVLKDTHTFYSSDPYTGLVKADEHDDTPLIQQLFILATNPLLASKVQVLSHCCHTPTPSIFTELPIMHFDSPYLSGSKTLRQLIELATRNMVNVHTLRVINGHRNIVSALLETLLDPTRSRLVSVRKLWLESCSIAGARLDVLLPHHELESLRIRRLRAEYGYEHSAQSDRESEFRASRGTRRTLLHDGAGGFYDASIELGRTPNEPTPPQYAAYATEFDTSIWEDLPEISHFVSQNSSLTSSAAPPSRGVPQIPISALLCDSQTMTSICLDWIVWGRVGDTDDRLARQILDSLAKRRFPNLRAFQIRNAVTDSAKLPPGIYLLDSPFLNFMEAHPKIQCLAFPLDRFYSHIQPTGEMQARARRVVAQLAALLVDLRLDASYGINGDSVTDGGAGDLPQMEERLRRRRFISEFVPYMIKVQSIKLEGGIPRDEKREILRALHYCPLKKIVMIGACFPLGNTWGRRGVDLKHIDAGMDQSYDLEEENKDALMATSNTIPRVQADFEFSANYGWPSGPPLLHTVAAHHADAVEELKFCGYNGSPVLSDMFPITRPLLAPLVHFHNLRQLVISFWLQTYFDRRYRDTLIIKSWRDARDPSSTALVCIGSGAREYTRWYEDLVAQFTPSVLANRVATDIGPYLSPIAKERPGGVRVRASFCLGVKERYHNQVANDIFNLDIRIGGNNQVLDLVGPREEGEKGRWWGKLEARRWF